MGVSTSAELKPLTSEQIGDYVAGVKVAYRPYKQNIIDKNINGEFLSNCGIDEASVSEIFEDLGITNRIHQWGLRELLSNVRDGNKKDTGNNTGPKTSGAGGGFKATNNSAPATTTTGKSHFFMLFTYL